MAPHQTPTRTRSGAGILSASLLIASTALAIPGLLPAEQVYKSIDAQGNVTYSSTPPSDADIQRIETLEVPAGPTPEEQAAAEARARELEAQASQREAELTQPTRQRASSVAQAEQALQEARQALAEAQERESPEDWQTLASGGRVPSAAYLQRVQEAQEQVQAAEEALRKARLGGG
jgi:predicted nucleic acid-binding Zn ribbon protein